MTQYLFPPHPKTAEGKLRRIGLELEFAGLKTDEAAHIVANVLQGKSHYLGGHEFRVEGSEHGDYRVKLDSSWARETENADLLDELAKTAAVMGEGNVVPVEVVGPPLPLDQLAEFDAIIEALRYAGAQGSDTGLLYAFGLHLNPELPSLEAKTITAYLKAFLILYDWLLMRCQVDWSRRLTAFIDPFAEEYVRRVVHPDYQPSLTTLIDDYVQANPTRNRALDMVPLFAHLDNQRLRKQVQDPRIKARPTLHYRLPNSEVDKLDWTIADTWNDWLRVEALADDDERLNRLGQQYHEHLSQWLAGWRESWLDVLLSDLA